MNGDPGGCAGLREAGDPLCQGTPRLFLGLGMEEIGERKFPRGAWPPFFLVPGAKTFHLLRLAFYQAPAGHLACE